MNIYELSYAATVMCYRNIDALEECHVVCGEATEELYSIICKEFIRRFDMLVKVLTDSVSNEEEYAFLYYLAICSRGYEQWDKPKIVCDPDDDLVEYVLMDVKKACLEHERLTEETMKRLNKSVHDRVYTYMVMNALC